MPTPYGSRGGMAFGVAELRVLRRALALALHPGPASAEDVQDCLGLAEQLDEAMREGARLRAFLVADLARYRAALPGTAAGYLALLREALDAGHRPLPDDLAALGALRGNPAAAALLERTSTFVPACRTPLQALPGGGKPAEEPAEEPARKPEERPTRRPAERPGGEPAAPRPSRPIPTPGEVFPRRKPAPPSGDPSRRLAAV
ncbi:hypothetical protein ACFY0F_37810 [Streptomyces sp. NPDC001544]|uniref:hypothetical protein n=1 Tax=Streptomyces sp. NPDC001544 TaxID=3364584 RepID=UPI0036AE8ECD